jgi:hypothetical protein
MENNIPTAEEFATEHNEAKMPRGVSYQKEIGELMIEFAKLHVQAALKEALDSIPCLGSSSDIPTYEEVENAVLNAYPLDKIK